MSELKQRLNELNDEFVEQKPAKRSAEQKPQSSLSRTDLESKIRATEYHRVGKKTTICLLHMENGHEVVGTSACVDPRNFDSFIGKQAAYEDAVDKLWALEGYLLQEALQPLIPDYEG